MRSISCFVARMAMGFVVLWWHATTPIVAEAQTTYVLKFCNKDSLIVSSVVTDADSLTCVHDALGVLRIPMSHIESIETRYQAEHTENRSTAKQALQRGGSDADQPQDKNPKSGPEELEGRWRRLVSASISGSEGTNDGLNARIGLELKRSTLRNKTAITSSYERSKDAEGIQKSRFDGDARNDVLLTDSPWRIFGKAKVEHDEYADWDWRTTVTTGFGYEFLENDKHELIGRSGAGVLREFGGSNEDLVPVGVLGADYSLRISETSGFGAVVEYTPDLTDLSEFRTESAASYRIRLRDDEPLTLQLGTSHRFDSGAESNQRHDYQYFMALGLEF